MLQLRSLKIEYGPHKVIDGLTTTSALRPGTITAVLGPNGSGKSTLLKAIAGLIQVGGGEILFNDENLALARFSERAKQAVYLPQSLPAAVHLRVFESVLVAANATAVGGRALDGSMQAVQTLLDRLGIAHLAMWHLDGLSGGQKQLVGLAQALVRQPRLLLLDEPLSALDLNYQFHVIDLLRQETRERGLVTLIVLHDLGIALRHTDYCLVLHDKKLAADGNPTTVINSEILATVYGVQARIEACSRGFPQVIVDGPQTAAALA